MQMQSFALPAIPQNQFCGSKCDKLGSLQSGDAAKMKAADESIAAQRDTFLKTLEDLSSHQGGSDVSAQAVRIASSEGDAINVVSMPTEILNDTIHPGKDSTQLLFLPQTDPDQNAIATPFAAEPSFLVSVASAAGTTPTESDPGLVPGPADVQFQTVKGFSAVTDSAALAELIARLEQNGQLPSSGTSAWLNRFRQLLAMTTPMQGTAPNSAPSFEAIRSNPIPEPAVSENLQNGICPSEAGPKEDIFWRMGDGSNGQQTSPAICRPLPIAASFSSNVVKTESMQPDGNINQALNSENRGEFYFEKAASQLQSGNSEIPLAQDAATAKEPSDSMQKANFFTCPDNLKRTASSPETTQGNGGADLQDHPQKKNSVQDSVHTDSTAANKNAVQPSPGEEPISKIINDAQVIRDPGTKLDTASGEEVIGKALKVDGGHPDASLQGSQNQTADRAFETASSPKEAEPSLGSLREQTMDQLVKKAVIHLRNGQGEAKIHLKPEFLGHIRMQVVTENHQVSIKILAEHAFVKEMLENNIQQLKSDLQQHGLAVERLEVSVSRDSAGFDHAREYTQRLKAKHRRGENGQTVDPTDETLEAIRHTALTPGDASTIDYFA
jgi:flagellar hook-length control protein FliK